MDERHTKQEKSFIILHGWGGSGESWKNVEKSLTHSGFRVFVPDLNTPRIAWSIDDYVRWVVSEMKKWGLNSAIILGHSFGGRIAIKLAAQHPEKVEKLILCAAAGIKHPLTWKQKALQSCAKIGKRIFHPAFMRPLQQSAKRFLYTLAGSKDYLEAGLLKETFKNVIAEDLRPCLEKIRAKTLIVWGDKDRMTPVNDAYIMEKEIPDARLKVFQGIRHGVHLQAPERLTKEINKFCADVALEKDF